jgi:hypothetical protein
MKQATWNVRSKLVFIGVAFLLLQGCSNANLKVNSSSSVAGSADQPKKINYQFEIAATDGSKYGVLNHDSNQNFYFHMENEDKFVWINRNKVLSSVGECNPQSVTALTAKKGAELEKSLAKSSESSPIDEKSYDAETMASSAAKEVAAEEDIFKNCLSKGFVTSITTAYRVYFEDDGCSGQKYIVSAAGPNSSIDSYGLLPNPVKGLLNVLLADKLKSSYQIVLHETAGYSGPIKFMSMFEYGTGAVCISLSKQGGVDYLDSLKINPSSVNIEPLLDQRPFVDY